MFVEVSFRNHLFFRYGGSRSCQGWNPSLWNPLEATEFPGGLGTSFIVCHWTTGFGCLAQKDPDGKQRSLRWHDGRPPCCNYEGSGARSSSRSFSWRWFKPLPPFTFFGFGGWSLQKSKIKTLRVTTKFKKTTCSCFTISHLAFVFEVNFATNFLNKKWKPFFEGDVVNFLFTKQNFVFLCFFHPCPFLALHFLNGSVWKTNQQKTHIVEIIQFHQTLWKCPFLIKIYSYVWMLF